MAGSLSNTYLSFAAGPVLDALAGNWRLILLRGICAILFGVLTFVWPGLSLLALVLLFGAFVLADGILSLAAAITGGTASSRWWLAIVGLLGIAAGAATFLWPGMTAVALKVFIALWAMAIGIMQMIGAILVRKEIDNEWLLIAGGALSIGFGVFLLMQPAAGALALAFTIGAYAVLYGSLLVSFSLRLRRHTQRVTAAAGRSPSRA
jgi:uncharacterized membrane protein HdeD (DUF308 family)